MTMFAIGERPPSDTGFGFAEAFRLPGDAEKYPPPTMLPQSEWTVERFRQAKYAIAGTVDQVKREIEQLKTLGGEGDLEWFGWFFDQGFMPWGGGDASDRALRRAHHPGLPLSGVQSAILASRSKRILRGRVTRRGRGWCHLLRFTISNEV
jgi:hypothetical protein